MIARMYIPVHIYTHIQLDREIEIERWRDGEIETVRDRARKLGS